MKWKNVVHIAATFLAVTSAHAVPTTNMSGMVTDSVGNALVGIGVSLAIAGNATKTDIKGAWAISSSDAGIQEYTQDAANSVTKHIVLAGGHIRIQFEGMDAEGRRDYKISQLKQPVHQDSQRMLGAVFVDTILYSWKGIIRDREPISTYSQIGLVEIIDTNNLAAATSSGTVTDADGNTYKTMTYGTQTWMIENLRTSTMKNGAALTEYDNSTQWWQNSVSTTTAAYCSYGNDPSYSTKYGYIYNYNAVSSGMLAPTGWHIPSEDEWTQLQDFLIAHGYKYDSSSSDNEIGKALASSSGWESSTNIGAVGNSQSTNNSSTFSGAPGGYRDDNGVYQGAGSFAVWWTSTFSTGKYAEYVSLYYANTSLIYNLNASGYSGKYVRCIKD